MIKIEDLRIFNRVRYGNNEVSIWSINFEGTIEISCDGDNEGESNYSKFVAISELASIPITDVLKVKLGFEVEPTYAIFEEDYCFIGKEFWYKGKFLREIEDLHSFQNLIYALTGEELTIKNL